MTREEHDDAGVLLFPPLVYLLPLGLALLIHNIAPFYIVFERSIIFPLAGLLFGLGLILLFWSLRVFHTTHENPSPFSGTDVLITNGPYRISRNPMYLSFTLMYLGASFFINTWWPIFFIPLVLAVIYYAVIQREERYMERKFGDTYTNYINTTRRWL